MATTRREAASAGDLLRDVARLHVRAQRAVLVRDGIGATTCTILTELGREPAMTLARLARQLRLDKSWTSRAVEQLVAEGLVEKVAGASDRRTVALSLTRTGRALHRRLERSLGDQVAGIIARVPAGDRAALDRTLVLLRDAYLAELAEPADPEDASCPIG